MLLYYHSLYYVHLIHVSIKLDYHQMMKCTIRY
jgi:hypothetical protein